MAETSTYDQLQHKITELEKEHSERLRIQEALKKSEQKKSAILDSLVEHVIHEDTDMKIQWANQAACESAGLTLEELIGHHCY